MHDWSRFGDKTSGGCVILGLVKAECSTPAGTLLRVTDNPVGLTDMFLSRAYYVCIGTMFDLHF